MIERIQKVLLAGSLLLSLAHTFIAALEFAGRYGWLPVGVGFLLAGLVELGFIWLIRNNDDQ